MRIAKTVYSRAQNRVGGQFAPAHGDFDIPDRFSDSAVRSGSPDFRCCRALLQDWKMLFDLRRVAFRPGPANFDRSSEDRTDRNHTAQLVVGNRGKAH